MLGSYYQQNDLKAIGDASASDGEREASRALLELFPSLRGNRYVVWAEQVGEASWADRVRDTDFLAVPVKPEQLERAEEMAGHHSVPFVAIDLPKPIAKWRAEELFRYSPYELFSILVTYRHDDPSAVPTPRIFLIGRLREQGARPGVYAALERNAARAGGRLMMVYDVPAMAAPRARPPYTAESVINGTAFAVGRNLVAAAAKQQERQLGQSDGKSWLIGLAVGGLAAYGLCRLYPSKRGRR